MKPSVVMNFSTVRPPTSFRPALNKIHSHYVGPTDSNKPFTSEPYFALADGPLGPMMRARIGDPEQLILLRIVPNANPENPKSLNDSALAKLVPNTVAQDWEQ